MKPATHSGTCQVCGHVQKLPEGLLALHGYTVSWGFFSGSCHGSNNKPFELDISLIRGAIEFAKSSAASNRAEAARRLALTDVNDVFDSVYPRGGSWSRHETGAKRFHGRVERRPMMQNGKQLVVEGREYWGIYFVATDDKGVARKHGDQPIENRLSTYSVAEAVASLNKSEAWRLKQLAKQADQYVEWQQKRIAGWKADPSKLIPVKARTLMAKYWVYEEWRTDEYDGFVALEVAPTKAAALKHMREQFTFSPGRYDVQTENHSFFGEMVSVVDHPDTKGNHVYGRVREIGEV